MTPTEVRKLKSLAEHGKTRDMAIYAQTCSKLEAIQKKINALRAEKHRLSLPSDTDLNTNALWQRWAESEIDKMRLQHQDVETEKEAARQIALKSVAKVQALEMLLKKALKEETLIMRRRAEQNGQPPDA